MDASDVSVVVCTKNSNTGIERCLQSLRDLGVGELIVVDAASTDGTRDIAHQIADQVLEDPGTGLGQARNLGIEQTTRPLILNMGSDNVMPAGQLQTMIDDLLDGGYQGVSAQTVIEGEDYVSKGLNAWRRGRFIPGPALVIGTPTLFDGDLLRSNPYDPTRAFSDDSELCERWARDLGSTFAISRAHVVEIGKATWNEVKVRCRMYGISDDEVFSRGSASGWNPQRKMMSLLHPIKSDLLLPLQRLPIRESVANTPFLVTFTALRYGSWIRTATAKK
jgi:glycosyltransferase involved in cell wall biosynthesis